MGIRQISIISLLAMLALNGCATVDAPDGASAPDLGPIAGQPVSAHGYLVVACVNQAIQNQSFDMIEEADGENHMVRFQCDGGPATMLFNALAARSAAIGSQWSAGTVLYRSTERIEHDLYGSDLCWRDIAASDSRAAIHGCQFNLNLGAFIAP
jgi:hypothetical protein